MSFKIKKNKNLTYGEFTEFNKQGIITAVSFRQGGISSSPYNSLNLGLHTNDNKRDVLENRRVFFSSLNINFKDIITLKQIHSNKIKIIQKKDKGKGAFDHNESISEADGMATKEVNLPLVIFTADCMPVFLMDPVKRVIGLAHAGWKGTLAKIAVKIIKVMEKLGADPHNIISGLGPSIGRCCYEVGKDFAAKADNKWIKIIKNKVYFDLDAANTEILISAGIKKDHIIHSDYCTFCYAKFCFSYRKAGLTGRMASVIMLKK